MTREQYNLAHAILSDVAHTRGIRMMSESPYGMIRLANALSGHALECGIILREQGIPFIMENRGNSCVDIIINIDITETDLSDIERALKVHQTQVENLSRLVGEL